MKSSSPSLSIRLQALLYLIVVLLGIPAGLIFALLTIYRSYTDLMYEQATENLALYANANNQKLIGCEPQDDDLDGYVSCFTQENAARAADVPPSSVPTKKHRLECGYLWNKGCFERSGGATKPAQF